MLRLFEQNYYPNLKYLNCSLNRLTELDVTLNTKLEELICSGNQLTSLDLSNNKELYFVDCTWNKIEGENMTALVESLNDTEMDIMPKSPRKAAEKFYFSGKRLWVTSDPENGYEEGNAITVRQVAAANAKGWSVWGRYYDEETGWWNGEEYQGLKQGDVNGDGVVDVADIATVISIMAANARQQHTI